MAEQIHRREFLGVQREAVCRLEQIAHDDVARIFGQLFAGFARMALNRNCWLTKCAVMPANISSSAKMPLIVRLIRNARRKVLLLKNGLLMNR